MPIGVDGTVEIEAAVVWYKLVGVGCGAGKGEGGTGDLNSNW